MKNEIVQVIETRSKMESNYRVIYSNGDIRFFFLLPPDVKDFVKSHEGAASIRTLTDGDSQYTYFCDDFKKKAAELVAQVQGMVLMLSPSDYAVAVKIANVIREYKS